MVERGKPTIEQALMTAVQNHNRIREARGDHVMHVTDETRFGLTISDKGISNEKLAVTVIDETQSPLSEKEGEGGAGFVHIGHYDPGRRDFQLYPELVPESEAEVIKPRATELRERAIQEKGALFDYDAPVIQRLHAQHREVLGEAGLIDNIARRESRYPQGYKIDDKTSYYAWRKEELVVDSLGTEDIGIALEGGLFGERRVSGRMHLGIRDLFDPSGEFQDPRIVTPEEFRKVASLTDGLKYLKATQYPNLDTEVVALREDIEEQ